MRNFKEQLINSLDSVLLAMVAVWTITVGTALFQHEPRPIRSGTVEIYSLTPADLTTASLR
jgi:hypothetical protein